MTRRISNLSLRPSAISWLSSTLVAAAALFSASSAMAATATEYIILRPATAVQCVQNDLEDGCVEICRGEEEFACSFRQEAPQPLLNLEPNSQICTRKRCVPSALILNAARTATKKVVVFDTSKADACSATRPAGILVETGNPIASAIVPVGVIPPGLWELFRESCCEDCWAVHRAAGLACSMDNVCCMGTCGVQPGCDDGGGTGGGTGGGPGSGGGTGGDDGDSCGASFTVTDATVTTQGGETCLFSGTVNPTVVDGICTDLAGDGFIYGCDGGVGGGTCLEIPETEGNEAF